MRLKCILLSSIIGSGCCMAKDVIVTKDAEQIEAKIVEVSKTELKYKKANDPDGPTFIISTDDISTVVYENGDIQTYKHSEKQAELVTVQKKEKNVNSFPKLTRSKITLPNGKRRKRYHNEDNSVIMTNAEFETHIRTNCPAAAIHLRKSTTWGLIAIPMDFLFLPAGIVFTCISLNHDREVLPTYNNQCAE